MVYWVVAGFATQGNGGAGRRIGVGEVLADGRCEFVGKLGRLVAGCGTIVSASTRKGVRVIIGRSSRSFSFRARDAVCLKRYFSSSRLGRLLRGGLTRVVQVGRRCGAGLWASLCG